MSPSRVIPFPSRDQNNCCPNASQIAAHEQAIEDLQTSQARVESRVEVKLDQMESRIAKLLHLIIGILASALVACAGWVIAILSAKK